MAGASRSVHVVAFHCRPNCRVDGQPVVGDAVPDGTIVPDIVPVGTTRVRENRNIKLGHRGRVARFLGLRLVHERGRDGVCRNRGASGDGGGDSLCEQQVAATEWCSLPSHPRRQARQRASYSSRGRK